MKGKFRLKRREIEAVQFNGDNWSEIVDFLKDTNEFAGDSLYQQLSKGDYVMNSNGNISIVDEEEFNEFFEPVPKVIVIPDMSYNPHNIMSDDPKVSRNKQLETNGLPDVH